MPRTKGNGHRWLLAGLVVFALLYAVISPFFVTDVVQGRVTGKQGQAGAGNYIIFVRKPDGSLESLANRDTYMRWKFNSTDVQGEAEVGKEYEFRVLGYRSHFWSTYRNIIEVTPVAQ